jgi:hypothetical protein
MIRISNQNLPWQARYSNMLGNSLLKKSINTRTAGDKPRRVGYSMTSRPSFGRHSAAAAASDHLPVPRHSYTGQASHPQPGQCRLLQGLNIVATQQALICTSW